MSEETAPTTRARRRGRTVAIAAYSLFMGAVASVWGLQVMQAVWFPPSVNAPDCSVGLRALRDAVASGARDAWDVPEEAQALATFRARVDSAWRSRAGLEQRCASVAGGDDALLAVDRLRYDTEAALRLSAGAAARRNALLDAVAKDPTASQPVDP